MLQPRRALIVTLVFVGALTAVFGSLVTGRSRAADPSLAVLGFQSQDSPLDLLDRNARVMTEVGVDGIDLTGPGLVSAPDRAALRQLARAHADRLPAVLLVGNWSSRINDFSERLAHETLGSRVTAVRAASAVASAVATDGWNGVSVDLESLTPRDSAGLTQFVESLRADMPAADSLTVCLQAATSASGYVASGYDLRALAASANQLVLMTYDDHGPWENTPGPIGPLRWQRAAVRALESAVRPDQILLGAADYGYGWRPHSNISLNVDQARALVARWHAHARWAAAAGEWTARLRDGSTLWWSDGRSVALRIQLARALRVYGMAVWSLGTGNPLPGG